jgi:hypothetical protein
MQSIEFLDRGKRIESQEKTGNFIKSVLDKNYKIEINRQVVPLTTDLNEAFAYINDSPYDKTLHDLEIPIQDAIVLTTFTKIFHEQLDKKNSNKQIFDAKTLLDTLEHTIQVYHTKASAHKQNLETTVHTLLAHREAEVQAHDAIEKALKDKAASWIKWGIRITIVQWIVLFYLTYYGFGWDVTEPIGYLIALGIETAGIFYFLRYTKGLEQKNIFKFYRSKFFKQFFLQKSSHPNCEINFLNKRLDHNLAKAIYTTQMP